MDMSRQFFDQFSLLHFASGVTAYFWFHHLVSFKTFLIFMVLFELFQNSAVGMDFMNHYIPIWPKNRREPEPWVNMMSDVLFLIIGWQSAFYLDEYYRRTM